MDEFVRKVNLSDEDYEHIRMWQKLPSNEKATINELAHKFADNDNKTSLYELIKLQTKITDLLTVVGHVSAFGRFVLKLSVYAGALMTLGAAILATIKIYGWKP